MANKEHLELLKQVLSKWNEWQAANPGVTPNLEKADLIEANLSGAILNMANLKSANLFNADGGVRLARCQFERC